MFINMTSLQRGLVTCCALAVSLVATGNSAAADTVTMTVVHQFDGSPGRNEGAQPGTIVFGSDGSLYGTSFYGGLYGAGTIFKIGADGRLSTIYTFKGPDGNWPNPCLLPGADGNFYGTVGEHSNKVRVFSITPAGIYTLLAVFFTELGPQDQRSIIVRATDGQRYAIASYGITSFVLVQQTAAARRSPAYQLLSGIVPTGVGLERPNYVSLEDSSTRNGDSGKDAAIPQARRIALCGDIAPAADGHFWKASLIRDSNSWGPPARSVSTNIRDGFRPAIPMYKPPSASPGTPTQNPDWQAASGVSGRLAEDDNGVMLAMAGEHEIIGISRFAEITRHIPLAPLGDKTYATMGLLHARDGYFYGLALAGDYNGYFLIYRTSAEGPPKTVYRFPQSGPRETIRSPIVEGPDGSLYVTTIDGGKDRRGAIYRVKLLP